MTSKIVTDYLRNLAERIRLIAADGGIVEGSDIEQLYDLADTLDGERAANDRPTN